MFYNEQRQKLLFHKDLFVIDKIITTLKHFKYNMSRDYIMFINFMFSDFMFY